MRLEGSFEVDQPANFVWTKVKDPNLMAGCIPGCQNVEQLDEKNYRADVLVTIGIIRASFNLNIEVTKEIENLELQSRTTGQEGTQASIISSENTLSLKAISEQKTKLEFSSEVTISGRLGKYGLGIIKKSALKMADEFAANFSRAIETGSAKVTTEPIILPKPSIWHKILEFLGMYRAIPFGKSNIEKKDPQKFSQTDILLNPSSISDAIEMLVANQHRVPIAGGATLVAMLNANLIDPAGLVNLKGLAELSGISRNSSGEVKIGALSRHAETAESDLLIGGLSGLKDAAQKIANPIVRNMGTMGGSVAFADPAADYIPALVAADAEIEIASSGELSRLPIRDFFVDWYKTVLKPGEIISALYLPKPNKLAMGHHEKFARVEGDYATASVNIILSMKGKTCDSIKLAVGACGPMPVRLLDVEKRLEGSDLSETLLLKAGKELADACDPTDDVRGTADYRRKLVPQLVICAVQNAQKKLLERRPT